MKLVGWIAGFGLVFGLAGCGPKAPSQEPAADGARTEGKRLQIAVIPKGSTHEFWKSVHAGAKKAGEELGVDIIWKGPLKEDDREDQIKVVEDFVTRGVDGIVLAPLDDTALRQPVREAAQAGIPVVIIDSGLKDAPDLPFVATDNLEGGRLAGRRLLEILPKGKVVMLRYQEGSASTAEREAGFLEVAGAARGIEVISAEQYGGATTETAQKASENLLARFRNPDGTTQFDGVFTPNESTTFGMLRALQDAGLAGKVRFVGFDASSKLVEALGAGQIDGLVLQNPRNMGYLGVKTLVQRIRDGKAPEMRIDTGATVVTKDNQSEPAIAELLRAPE